MSAWAVLNTISPRADRLWAGRIPAPVSTVVCASAATAVNNEVNGAAVSGSIQIL
jgi:hypothetical protein